MPKSEQLQSVQYPSIHSQNPTQRKQSLSSLFIRPLTPNTTLDITQPVHYTETESDHARLSMGQTDTFLVPALDIAKLNAIVEPHLANSRLQSYLKGNARMFTQYLAHLKNKQG